MSAAHDQSLGVLHADSVSRGMRRQCTNTVPIVSYAATISSGFAPRRLNRRRAFLSSYCDRDGVAYLPSGPRSGGGLRRKLQGSVQNRMTVRSVPRAKGRPFSNRGT